MPANNTLSKRIARPRFDIVGKQVLVCMTMLVRNTSKAGTTQHYWQVKPEEQHASQLRVIDGHKTTYCFCTKAE